VKKLKFRQKTIKIRSKSVLRNKNVKKMGRILRKVPTPSWLAKIPDPFENLPFWLQVVLSIPIMFGIGMGFAYLGYWLGSKLLAHCLFFCGILLGTLLPPRFKGYDDLF
jgi:hypothetical protein